MNEDEEYLKIVNSEGLFPPIYLRNGTSDMFVYKQILVDNEYDLDLGFVPQVILDCGANIGLASIYFKRRYPLSKVICIEPESNNFELLKKNVENIEGVYCHKSAIWDVSQDLSVNDIGNGYWGYIVSPNNDSSCNEVRSIGIYEIMQMYDIDTIDILKIDIEGSEVELFRSNYDLWLPKTKLIIVELHDELKAGCSKSLFTALKEYDFKVSALKKNLVIDLR